MDIPRCHGHFVDIHQTRKRGEEKQGHGGELAVLSELGDFVLKRLHHSLARILDRMEDIKLHVRIGVSSKEATGFVNQTKPDHASLANKCVCTNLFEERKVGHFGDFHDGIPHAAKANSIVVTMNGRKEFGETLGKGDEVFVELFFLLFDLIEDIRRGVSGFVVHHRGHLSQRRGGFLGQIPNSSSRRRLGTRGHEGGTAKEGLDGDFLDRVRGREGSRRPPAF